MENAPFGVNRKQNGFLEKVCKSVLFFVFANSKLIQSANPKLIHPI